MTQQVITDSGYVDVGGAQLYYEVAGQGHPLVFVHAGICDCRMWEQQFGFFAQYFRVVRYDMRGYGKSTPVSQSDFAHRQDLYYLLRHLGIDHAYFVGCSMGGSTLIDFALDYPLMVAALVLVGSRPNGFVRESAYVPPQWDDVVASFKAGNLERASELEVQIWVDGPKRKPGDVPAAIRDLVREMNMIALQNEKREQGINRPLEPAAVRRLEEIRAPVLAIAGELDDPDVVRAAHVMRERIHGAQIALMPDTAHVPNMEHPEAFNRLVLDFLQGVGH